LLDEAAAVAIEQQNTRRNRLLWTMAGTLLAFFLLWSQLKSRAAASTPPSDVPLLPPMSGSVASSASNPHAQAQPEPAPIDIDSDESTQLAHHENSGSGRLPRREPRASGENGGTRIADPHQGERWSRERAPIARTESVQSTQPIVESAQAVPKKRAWFSEE
jgi:hypothetical protein